MLLLSNYLVNLCATTQEENLPLYIHQRNHPELAEVQRLLLLWDEDSPLPYAMLLGLFVCSKLFLTAFTEI